jgi:hypothetical protein
MREELYFGQSRCSIQETTSSKFSHRLYRERFCNVPVPQLYSPCLIEAVTISISAFLLIVFLFN